MESTPAHARAHKLAHSGTHKHIHKHTHIHPQAHTKLGTVSSTQTHHDLAGLASCGDLLAADALELSLQLERHSGQQIPDCGHCVTTVNHPHDHGRLTVVVNKRELVARHHTPATNHLQAHTATTAFEELEGHLVLHHWGTQAYQQSGAQPG